MTLSYTLFLALLLLTPGFGLWLGLRFGEHSSLISQAPEKPGSTFNLLTIVLGALLGHIALSGTFAGQSAWCDATGLCFQISFDPNIYVALLGKESTAKTPSDFVIFGWLSSLLVPTLALAGLGFQLSSWPKIRDAQEAAAFGWLKKLVDLAKPTDSFILAYVVTSLEHEGANVAYEGIVENLALDENRSISMLVLSQCDRFLVRITEDDVKILELVHSSIPLIHLTSEHYISVALEVIEDLDADKSAD